ncbi:MAG: PAS domain S-box protein, partial [Candidatus Latescibacteria bacterium]|nr:PAS domain S-box protein [Candidatus Latescibacterota bacterium]
MAILAKPSSVRFVQMLRLAVVLFTAAAVFFFLRDSYGGDAVFVVDIPLAALIAVNILSTLWLWQHLRRSGTVEEEQFYLQVFLDVMLMGMVVFYTGASSSTLTLLFLLPVILASAFLYLRGSLFAASLSTIVLAALFYLDVNGWLADYGPNYLQSALDFMTDEDAPLLLAQSITTILALFATAAISGYLAENQLSIIRELGELTRRLERIRINTSDVLTNLESGLLTVDADGTIIFLNRTAREILQVEEPEPEGRNYDIVFSGRLEPIGEFVRTILGRSSPLSARNELQLETADGEILPLGLTPTLLRDAHTTRGMVLIFQDLTQAKVTEDKIR